MWMRSMGFSIVENFVIYYEVNKSSMTVTIARIMYGGRDAENIINL